MNNLKLITTTWNYEDSFDLNSGFLFPSFKKFNPDIDFIHIHYNRNKYKELEQDYIKYGIQGEYLLYKIYFLLEEIKCIDSKYLMFADANDMTCLKPLDGILELFDLDNFIIMCHEKNMMPSEFEKSNWINYKGYSETEKNKRIFLNSGLILARKDLFIKMLESIIANVFSININSFRNDQGVYTYYYNNKIKPEIKLDEENKLVVNTYTRNVNEFYKNEKNQLVDKSNGNIPYFVHDNGWNYGSPKYHDFFQFKKIYSKTYDHLKNISLHRPIPSSHQQYLYKLKQDFNFIPEVIYDIGACVLHWTNIAKEIWPNSRYILFEAMEESEELFKEFNYEYQIDVLSDIDYKEVIFYKSVESPGGNSYYLENSKYSSVANQIYGNINNQFKRKTITLDTVRKNRNFPYPDLIKIDVQGCEIDILNGAKETIKNAKHLIVELQHVEYNIGAKLVNESIPIIENMGFKLITPKFSSNGPDGDYHFIKL